MNTPEPEAPDNRVAKGTNKHRVQNCPFCGGAASGAVAIQIKIILVADVSHILNFQCPSNPRSTAALRL